MNFGRIKDIFAHYLVESHVNGDDKGKKLYKKFLKSLNENEILKTQFIVYKNIEKTNNFDNSEAHDYLKENISLFEKYGKSDIVESNENLLKVLVANGFDTNIDSPHSELYENINRVITLDKKATTLNRIQESFTKVKEFIKENKEPIDIDSENFVRKNIDADKFLSISVEKYNEKYEEQLNEEERKIVKTLREGTEEEKNILLEKYTKETITIINEQLELRSSNITLKETLLSVKDMVYNTIEDKANINESVLKLYDLKKNLTE